MSIPLVQKPEKDDINTSIIAIKRNIERINMLLGLVDSGSDPDLSGLATKQELQDAVTELTPVDEVTSGNMHSVTSNAVAEALDNYKIKHKTVKGTTNVNGILYKDNSGGTITGNELFINAKVTNSNDKMVEVGYSSLNGEWLQVQTSVNAVLSNTYVEIDVIYLEKVV